MSQRGRVTQAVLQQGLLSIYGDRCDFDREGAGYVSANALEFVQWARHPAATTIQDVGVDHRRLHVVVTQQFLHRSLTRSRRASMSRLPAPAPISC